MIGPHEYQSENESCVLPITKDSWQQTHVIPLRASVDYKLDGEVWTNLTLKLKVQGRTVYNWKWNVRNLNTEVSDPYLRGRGMPLGYCYPPFG